MLALGAFVLCTLAVARVTRVIVYDKIAIGFRRWVVDRNGETGWWTNLVHCEYCVSIWLSIPGALYWMWMILEPGWLWLWLAPALAAMAYLAALTVDRATDQGE